jgi:transposase
MGRAYSIDLRERVVAAVESGGLSCHRASAQFGVGVSTAIRERLRTTGSVAPSKIGGYKPRTISREHRTWLLGRIKEKDFTLLGLVGELAKRGLKVDYRSVWTFVHDEKLSFKKSVVAGERDRAEILPRPQPDRTGVRQAQALAAQSRSANGRNRLHRHRRASRSLHQERMRQLLQKLRICTKLNAFRFRVSKLYRE